MKVHFYYDGTLKGHSYAARSYARVLRSSEMEVLETETTGERWRSLAKSDRPTGCVIVQCFIPPDLRIVEGNTNIALVFHEWDRIPRGWTNTLSSFDQVWVSSSYLDTVLLLSGFEGDVRTIPIPIEIASYKQKKSWEAGWPFRFLSVGEWHFRKGFHMMFEAFNRAFPQPGRAELHIKTTQGTTYSPNRPDIKIITKGLDDSEMKHLFADYDAYITTTLAEGYGLPVAEAMAAKLPVLAPNWSGLKEFCGEGRTLCLPFSLHPQLFCSSPDYFAPGQRCAMVDIDASAEAMRTIVDAETSYREALAERACSHLECIANPDTIGAALLKIIAGIRQ
jgi:glycosyltransferase involved in cell wall biosynthesis